MPVPIMKTLDDTHPDDPTSYEGIRCVCEEGYIELTGDVQPGEAEVYRCSCCGAMMGRSTVRRFIEAWREHLKLCHDPKCEMPKGLTLRLPPPRLALSDLMSQIPESRKQVNPEPQAPKRASRATVAIIVMLAILFWVFVGAGLALFVNWLI